jgi:signal transduction histidine kinase
MADAFVNQAQTLAQTLARTLAQAQARIAELEAAVKSREDFIASVGHELRNPMVPIVLTVERLRDLAAEGDIARIRRSIDILVKATEAFTRRTTQMLDLARISSGSFALANEEMEVSQCIAETVERHLDIARRAGCTLQTRIEPGVTGRGDRAALEQLLDNLLSNAFKYGAGRPVHVEFAARGTQGCLQVRDGGAGIPIEEQGRIFGLFERARNLGAPGLGIGLWIAAQVAGAMGGSIRLQSAAGEGANFILDFPLAGAASAPSAYHPAAAGTPQ